VIRQRAFSFVRRKPADPVSIGRSSFAAFSSNLTRRANQEHPDIIAGISRARAGNGGGLFHFRNRMAAHMRVRHTLALLRQRTRVAVRASSLQPYCRRARTRPVGGARRRARPRPPCSQGIGFAPEMIASSRSCRAFSFKRGQAMNDRISDLARARVPGRDRRVGGNVVSADVVRFIPRPRSSGDTTDFPAVAFHMPAPAEDHADTAPCEYVAPGDHES
jgi:hypothetical protein